MQGPRSYRRTTSARRLNQIVAERADASDGARALHRPLSVYLQIASGCNLECYMCIELLRPPHARRGRGLQTLPREVFDKLAAQVFPYSSTLHIGFGGEPSLAPDFQHFIERGFELGQQVDLTTNGTRLDQPGIAAALARCVSYLQVSIDAATPATYERIRVGSSWTRLRANLDRLNEHRLAYARGERTRLALCFVLMKSNLDELPAFVELAAELDAEVVRAQHVIPTTEQGVPETLFDQPERFNAVRESAVRRARELGVELEVPKPYPIAERASPSSEPPRAATAELALAPPAAADAPARAAIDCKLPTRHLFVTYEGMVLTCCHPHANVKMKAGDLRTEDFDAIWNNAAFRHLRRSLESGDAHPICRTCSIAHDPPPAVEDVDMLRDGPTLEQWSAGRSFDEDAWAMRPLVEHMAQAGLLEHLDDVELDRDRWSEHARNLELERPHLTAHIRNLESERAGLAAHAANLEQHGHRLRERLERLERRDWIGKLARWLRRR